MNRISEWFKTSLKYFALAVFLFFGLKGCVVSMWDPPTGPVTYALSQFDGSKFRVILMPENRAYFVVSDRTDDVIGAVLASTHGTYGIHYFWRLWGSHNWNKGFFGYFLYPEGATPVQMNIRVLDEFTIDDDVLEFIGEDGELIHDTFLFREDGVRMEGTWLKKEPTDPLLLRTLRERLPESKAAGGI